jgi:hypothetical protein
MPAWLLVRVEAGEIIGDAAVNLGEAGGVSEAFEEDTTGAVS